MKNIFDFKRFTDLTVRQLVINSRTVGIALLAITGLLLFIGSLVVIFGGGTYHAKSFLALAMPFFFIGGFILSSNIFSELNNPHRGFLLLMLPATALEKILSAWTITSVMYVAFGALGITAINVLLMGLSSLTGSSAVEAVNVLSPSVIKLFGIYMVTQSVFFLGGIYFRGSQFFKTILTLFVINFAISIYTGTLAKLVFNDMSELFSSNVLNLWSSIDLDNIKLIGDVAFWGFLAPFMLTVAYFRMKEREV